MLCLKPITIYNSSRFVVSDNSDSLLLKVRCGRCPSCQQIKASDWYFRAYHQFKNCVGNGGFVLFDTLTYSNKYLPHLSDFDEFKGLKRDFPCFNRNHIRLFNVRLRRKLSLLGYGKNAYQYFISCEYGADNRYTHRPHYHVLFYINCNIDPLLFSHLVSQCWHYGRTDGLPYRSSSYVVQNVFRSMSIGGRKVCNYVSKYVQKSSLFEKQVEKRINFMIHSKFDLDSISSIQCKDYKRKLVRISSQFHLQSQKFGLSALNDIDIDTLIRNGCFTLPSITKESVVRYPISNYYIRHLFKQKITLDDGYECWIDNDLGLKYKDIRNKSILRSVSNQLRSLARLHNLTFDFDKLADYVVNKYGRLRSEMNQILSFGERLLNADLFVYNSNADKNYFGQRFVSSNYVGWNGNYNGVPEKVVPIKDFVEKNIFQNGAFETLLSKLYTCDTEAIQNRYDNQQYRKNIYKVILNSN